MAKSCISAFLLKMFILQVVNTSSLSAGLDATQCTLHGHKFSSGRLEARPLNTVTSDSESKCLAACLHCDECVSFNYRNSSLKDLNCELLDLTVCSGCPVSTSYLNWNHFAVGCLEGVQKKEKIDDYRACYRTGFCREECGAWGLAGRKQGNETRECLFGHTGTSFVTAFLRNFRVDMPVFLGVYISSYSPGAVTYRVSAPLLQSTPLASGTVEPYQTAMVDLPFDLMTSADVAIGDNGILVETSDAVAVYGYNAQESSIDTFTVMPLPALGTKHYLVTWPPGSFLLTATEDDTAVQVDLRQTDAVLVYQGTQYHNSVLSLDLEAYNTFHVYIISGDTDFSGTYIESNKPIVVHSGSNKIAFQTKGKDLVVDQIAPISTLGTEYVLVNAVNSELKSYFKVVSSEESVSVSLYTDSGEQHFTLSGSGSTEMFELVDPCAYIVADKPVGVVMLATSPTGDKLDNAFMLVPATAMWAYPPFVFATAVYTVNPGYPTELMIAVPVQARNELRLDGLPLSGTWLAVPGTADFSATSVTIAEGNHVISCANEHCPVFAAIYRNGNYASYLLSIGQQYK